MTWPATDKFVTWVLVLVGWAVVNELQDFREARKERLARVTELRRRLEDFEQKVLNFHTSTFNGNANLMIQSTLGSIARELKLLEDCKYIELQYQDLLIAFRKACTDSNFDKSSHQALLHDDQICLAIMAVREDLDRSLLAAQFDATNTTPSLLGVFWHMFVKGWRSVVRAWRSLRGRPHAR